MLEIIFFEGGHDMANKGTVFVSGGSGYIAGFIIKDLLERGFEVKTTIRNLSREPEVRARLSKIAPNLEKLTFFAADLNSDSGWDEAVKGSEYVLHTASPFPIENPKNADELIVPACEGALRVLRASNNAGVKRVIMTSSMAAISYGVEKTDTRMRTESDWTDTNHIDASHSAYILSKTLAEKAAWDFIKDKKMELVTICPSAVLGPILGDDFSSSIEIVRKLLKGDLPGLPRLGFQLVDVRDVADLHVKAMLSSDAAGQRFAAVNGFYWFKDIAQVLHDDLGVRAKKVPKIVLPDFVLKLASNFDPAVKAILGELGMVRNISNQKAKDALGWQPRDASISIRDTANSLIREGQV